MEHRRLKKSRSASRTFKTDRLNRNLSEKFTPKSNTKTSRVYDSNEQNGNIRSMRDGKGSNKTDRQNYLKNSTDRLSRSNSSKHHNVSSKKSSTKKKMTNRHRSDGSRNSSRKVLGFDSADESKRLKEDQKYSQKDYLFNKYEKLMKAKDTLARKHAKSKSPDYHKNNSKKSSKKKKRSTKQVQLVSESEDEDLHIKIMPNSSHSKPPLPKTPSVHHN